MGAKFLNIELEVRSPSNLGTLVKAFGRNFIVNYHGRFSPGQYLLSGSFARVRPQHSPDAIAIALCKMIKAIKPPAKMVWSHASDRVFDVGLDATIDQRAIVDLFSARTVREISKVGARIAVSVYAHDLEEKARAGTVRPANKRRERKKGRERH